MVLYPEVQKRAQAEIDSVIGSNMSRLPVWEDRSSLAYIDAVIKASCSTLRSVSDSERPLDAHSMA
ncbi:hypothetical protein JVT61DRAFT_6486 [Boletus reticuloceps]|uniref:Cytochrome P450 n=1 Tax=Boletus reticuloceps TaxID=495285 RepID=A0A8I2YKY8_9AGAM|nr:hypothetical protein JVT61DRAFT_6486 [Boletus reticuloceps]